MRERRQHRSAKSGLYVDADEAARNPATTVSEPRPDPSRVLSFWTVELIQAGVVTLSHAEHGDADWPRKALPAKLRAGDRVSIMAAVERGK